MCDCLKEGLVGKLREQVRVAEGGQGRILLTLQNTWIITLVRWKVLSISMYKIGLSFPHTKRIIAMTNIIPAGQEGDLALETIIQVMGKNDHPFEERRGAVDRQEHRDRISEITLDRRAHIVNIQSWEKIMRRKIVIKI